MRYKLTLCIPTNGIIEWVIPVLESIYEQKKVTEYENEFQVVVTDNGTNNQFKDLMNSYEKKYDNFVYKRTKAEGFLNQIECFKMAEGKLIKFVNHRMRLVEGAIDYLIRYSTVHDSSTVVYFLNGWINKKNNVTKCDNFNTFVGELSYYSSWSGGLAFWYDDIQKISDIKLYNTLFPHTDVLFMKRHAEHYEIINDKILDDVAVDETKKGHYNLFKAFSVEYPLIIQGLVKDGDISETTYNKIITDMVPFISNLYAMYVMHRRPCSYDLSRCDEYISKTFDLPKVKCKARKENIVLRMVDIKNKIIKRGR